MTNRPSVLLVDDDLDTREMYAWSLELRGFEVRCASHATQAIALAIQRPPDVVVTDFTLPGEDGFALAARLRESPALKETPLVLVSGRSFDEASGRRAMTLFDRVLLKPVLPDDVIAEIVPLMLDRTSATLQRRLREVRERVSGIPTGSSIGRVLSAVTEVGGQPPPAALLADSTARYIGVNDAACSLTGRSRDELLSLCVWDLTPEVDLAQGKVRWAQFVSEGGMSGACTLQGPTGNPIDACFAAFAHVLPGCHLSLLTPLPPGLVVHSA
jgi:CheY-like chemotaxis protein